MTHVSQKETSLVIQIIDFFGFECVHCILFFSIYAMKKRLLGMWHHLSGLPLERVINMIQELG